MKNVSREQKKSERLQLSQVQICENGNLLQRLLGADPFRKLSWDILHTEDCLKIVVFGGIQETKYSGTVNLMLILHVCLYQEV